MSTTPPIPLPSLADAITAAENAEAAYNTAVTQTASDQALADAAHAKATAADALVTTDKTAQSNAASADVQALQTLASVIQARISALTPPAAPSGS